MDLHRFLEIARTHGWQGIALWGVLAAQALLWVGLLRLHTSLRREDCPWDECVGKIRSALLRRVNGESELEELRIHQYAPLADQLIRLSFTEVRSDLMTRWLLMRWKAKQGIRPYWVRWGHLIIAFGVVVWFLYGLRLDMGVEPLKRTPCDPRLLWVWLGYAMIIAWKMVQLEGNLERVQRALLLPRREE